MRIYQSLGYTAKDRSYCEPKHSKKTQTLSEAKERCSSDSSCAMFYSDYSNDYDQYFLCNHGATIKDSWRHHSTLYVKSNRIIMIAKSIRYKIF